VLPLHHLLAFSEPELDVLLNGQQVLFEIIKTYPCGYPSSPYAHSDPIFDKKRGLRNLLGELRILYALVSRAAH
jgi:hypothetical protein